MVKGFLFYIFCGLLLLTGLLLISLTNQGILSIDPPYTRSLVDRLEPQSQVVAFRNVNAIPMDSERILEDQTVIVQDGIIAQVGSSAEIEIAPGALVVDGSGKYLVPGLVDMHIHAISEDELLLFVAHGVTSVRNMWGGMNFTDHLGWRDRIEAGKMFGPNFYTTGPVMEGPPKTMPLMPVYTDPLKAADAVAQQVAQGYDFIKVYDYLDVPVYEAIIEMARTKGLKVVGHTPKKVGLETVLSSGQVTIEHLSGFIDNDTGEYIIPENEIPEYARMAADAGVYICPTIGVYQMYVPNEDLHLLEERPEMAYISPGMKFLWQYFSLRGAMSSITYQGDYPARINEMFLHTTRVLHEQDVKIVLGTDSDNPYLVPGVSLLDELEYLAEAGFTPFEALEAGTRNAADAMGKMGEFGTIEPGKRADLILLNSSPLDSVSAVRDRDGVMLRGRWFPQSELQTYLEELVDSYKPAWYERIWPVGLVVLAVAMIWRKVH